MSVFISYGREDSSRALEIYDLLRQKGVRAWIDVRDLLPGQSWELEIDKAIRKCEIFLACLSRNSVSKRGFVQSELQRALKVLETVPEDQVFLILVRLDECEAPARLAHLQWVDYFAPDGRDKLVEAIDRHAATSVESVRPLVTEPALEQLIIQPHTTEYVNFMVFNPENTRLPRQIPDHSFIHYKGGIVAIPVPLEQIGLDPRDFSTTLPPHIPDGEMVIDFTVLNQGKTAIATGVFLEVIEVLDRPERALGSTFLPTLEPIEDTAVLTRGQGLFRLFADRVFSYKDGDVDLFRVNVLVADADQPGVFRFRFRVDYTVGTRRGKANSEDFYLAKFREGHTARIPYAKSRRRRHAQPHFPAAAETLGAGTIVGREEFSTDGSYYRSRVFRAEHLPAATMENFAAYLLSRWEQDADTDELAAHIQQDHWACVMSGQRDETQRNGFSRVPPTAVPDTSVSMGGLQTRWVAFKPSMGRGYTSQVRGEFEIYTGRDTVEYHALARACARFGETGAQQRQEIAARALVDAAQASNTDAAGVIDTVPLLACFRCEGAFKFLASLLTCGHSVIEKTAIDVFGSIVYSGAREPLLRIVKQPRSYSTSYAVRALAVNGNEATARAIVELYEQGSFHSTETGAIADVIFRSAPAWAHQLVREHAGSGSPEQRRLACELLALIKRHSDDEKE